MSYIKINLPSPSKSGIIALGSQSKSSFCIVKKDVAYLSKPDGDLNNLENFRLFERRIKELRKELRVRPRLIACDLHPEYLSTKYANDLAKSERIELRKIQHHEAHVAGCIVDNNIKGDVIGVAFDGTGFGRDNNIWGGEFFIGTFRGLKRVAHLQYIPMPGGKAAVKEPWRMSLSYLYALYGDRFRKLSLSRLDKKVVEMLIEIINKKINSPLTSSVGRLFDAVSSFLGICDVTRYEGQAAVELEKLLDAGCSILDARKKYSFNYREKEGTIIIDWSRVIKEIVKDMQNKKNKSEISLKFHNAVCCMIKDVCFLLKRRHKISKVCLSGGVFQNKYLTSHTKPLLEKKGFEVYFHKRVPAHDGSIALGQAVIVACSKEN